MNVGNFMESQNKYQNNENMKSESFYHRHFSDINYYKSRNLVMPFVIDLFSFRYFPSIMILRCDIIIGRFLFEAMQIRIPMDFLPRLKCNIPHVTNDCRIVSYFEGSGKD